MKINLKLEALDRVPRAEGGSVATRLAYAKEIYAWLTGAPAVERHSAAKALIPLTSAEAPRKRGRPKKAKNGANLAVATKRKYTKRNAEYWK